MRSYLIIASIVVVGLMALPVITLGSLTNLTAIGSVIGVSEKAYLFTGNNVSYDKYAWGNCTWWVSYLRHKIGNPIPNTWGNAIDWAANAKTDRYTVNHLPSAGSIMQDPLAPGGLGHVALVVSVDANAGTFTISEMNRLGLDIVDTRVISFSRVNKLNFIH